MIIETYLNSTEKKKPELLSPCGSPEALTAALNGGADAVYLGGTMLNARMNARNFNDNSLAEAVKLCHSLGVKLYVTLNTLVYDREFNDALKYAAFLYKIGVDAIITADLGLSSVIRKYIPEFEQHASTQVSGHNLYAAEFLKNLGFTRMVCARELSAQNISQLVENSPIEIEMFIHGAHCVSQSGQCLFSSMLGGRSGNRGECAQPCRMKYNDGYPLSLKDMCLAGHIADILNLGVASLKIEGRMKSPEYVYSVTSIYRRLIDENRNASNNEIEAMAGIFSRSGFTDAYFTGKISNSMLGVRSEDDKNATRKTVIKITPIERQLPKIEIRDRSIDLPEKFTGVSYKSRQLKRLSARFHSAVQIPDSHDFDIVYLPYDRFEKGAANGVVLPSVSLVPLEIPNGADHVLIANIGQMNIKGPVMHGDFRLNIFNSESCRLYSDFGFEDIILSPELILPQIRDIAASKCVIVYGRLPLMVLEKRVGVAMLRDRTNAVFPIMNEGSRDLVLNSVPIYMGDKMVELSKIGITNYHYIFTSESKKECRAVIDSYINGMTPTINCRRIKSSRQS